MYKENQNKLFNIIPDGDLIHVFVTVSPKKKDEIEKELNKIFKDLYLSIELDFDDDQFYFVLSNYEDYQAIKEAFYQSYLGYTFNHLEDMYNEDWLPQQHSYHNPLWNG